MNLRCLKLFRAYSISFKSSNFGNFFLELNCKGLHQSSGKEKESCCLVFSPRKIVALSRRSRALTAKKCTKKRDAKLLLSQSKLMAVLPFLLPSPSLLPKLPFVIIPKMGYHGNVSSLFSSLLQIVPGPVHRFLCPNRAN